MKKEKRYILTLDLGTTSVRAVLLDEKGTWVNMKQKEFQQFFPQKGWVEHDPEEILQALETVVNALFVETAIDAEQIAQVGITNQRETTVLWNKNTGEALYNAIVWQDKRTAAICEELKRADLEEHVKSTTGLVIDAYFSGSKIKWILDEVAGARALAEKGEVCFGTIDTWLMWKWSEGKIHATDYSNASRTMLFDIQKLTWDDTLLKALQIPKSILPQVYPSIHAFGLIQIGGQTFQVGGVAGDQQAALFGQCCFEAGSVKNTYGTGCFLLMNTGEVAQFSKFGMITTIAWGDGEKVIYALEGSVFIAGAAVQWLRDGLKLIDSATDSEYYASKAGRDGVYVVPAFSGLGAPHWDMYARGAIFGLTRDTGKPELIRATLESMAYQSRDVLEAMKEDANLELKVLRVDGGAASNDLLMQFQADQMNIQVERPQNVESTALGAAYMAGISAGLWTMDELQQNRQIDRTFYPEMARENAENLYAGWKKALKRTLNWVEDE